MEEKAKKKTELRPIPALISIALGVIVALLPAPEGLDASVMKFLGIFVFMIAGMLSKAAPNWMVTTTSCFAMILFKLTKIGTILSNFSSNNIWLPLAIVGFSLCLAKSGLLSRIAFNVYKLFPTTYTGQTLAVSAASLVLLPLIPSTSAKQGVLFPFTSSLAKEAGIDPHSKAMKGLWYVVFTCCYICSFCVLTGSNGNFLILGFAPEGTAEVFTWMYWLKICSVWLVVMVAGAIVFTILFMKPSKPISISRDMVNQKLADLGPMTGDEKYCLAVLAVAIVLWITESYHGINTTVIAWAALVAMFAKGLFTSKDIARLPWEFFMFLAGLLGMADYMGKCGLSDWLTTTLTPVVNKIIPSSFVFILVLIIVVWIVRLFVDSISTMAIIPVVFGPAAAIFGINPFIVVWISFVCGQTWILPHNTPSLQTSSVMMNNEIVHEDVRSLTFVYMALSVIATIASIPLWKACGIM